MWDSEFKLRHLEILRYSTDNFEKMGDFRGLYSSWRARVPDHWGKKTWDTLFLLAADYPHEKECWDDDEYTSEMIRERKKGWEKLLKSLPWVLTCGECAQHFRKYINRGNGRFLKKALENREELFMFLYKCKDQVNSRKNVVSPSYEKIRKKYIPRCGRK